MLIISAQTLIALLGLTRSRCWSIISLKSGSRLISINNIKSERALERTATQKCLRREGNKVAANDEISPFSIPVTVSAIKEPQVEGHEKKTSPRMESSRGSRAPLEHSLASFYCTSGHVGPARIKRCAQVASSSHSAADLPSDKVTCFRFASPSRHISIRQTWPSMRTSSVCVKSPPSAANQRLLIGVSD